ncbi:MAG: lytic murein transglycosylase [Mesorhizobium sp.]|nr:MAG: lytic murein transglycosylase [Mesorhizobium sp.]
MVTSVRGAPLWPAGHLPLKRGDQMSRRLSPPFSCARCIPALTLPISPLEGEMSGRTEGGVTERDGPDVRSSSRRDRTCKA